MTPRPGGAPGWVVVTTVLLALALSGSVLGAFLWSEQISDVEAEEASRDEVAQVASQFAVDVNTYSAADIDTYADRVSAQLTEDFSGSFNDALEGLVDQVRAAEIESEGTVLRTGVASVGDDSARVLVVADATVDSVFQTRVRHFRWEVELVRAGDEWLVDNFTPVA